MDPNETRMNLAALKRIDPYIDSIRASASQVALYLYKAQEWEKTDKEGTLFVYQRMCSPKYGFLILNRLSSTNWVQPVTSNSDTQLQIPFLLYKNRESEIFGIWFYEKQQCEIVANCINSLVSEVEKEEKAMMSSQGAANAPHKDLGSLLAGAGAGGANDDAGRSSESKRGSLDEDQSRKLLQLVKGKGFQNSDRQSRGDQHHQQQQAGGPRKPQGPPGLLPPEEQNNSVMNFFAQASQHQQAIGFAPSPVAAVIAVPGQQPPQMGIPMAAVPLGPPLMPQSGFISGPPPGIPFLNTLFFKPQPEHLSSGTGVISYGEPPLLPPLPKEAKTAYDLESDLKNKLNIQMNKNNNNGNTGANNNKNKQKPLGQQRKQELDSQKMLSYAAAVVSPGKQADEPNSAKTTRYQQQNRKFPQQQNKEAAPVQLHKEKEAEDANQLLSPMVFAQPVPLSKVEENNGGCSNGSSDQGVVMMTLLDPEACQQHFLKDEEDEEEYITPMTEQQLLQAFQYLLRTDTGFVGKLHQAYVESMNIKLK